MLAGKYDRYINSLLRYGKNDPRQIAQEIQNYAYLFTPETFRFIEHEVNHSFQSAKPNPNDLYPLKIIQKMLFENLPIFRHFFQFMAIHSKMQTKKVRHLGEKKYLGQIFNEILHSPVRKNRINWARSYMTHMETIQRNYIQIYEKSFEFATKIGFPSPVGVLNSLGLTDYESLYHQAKNYLQNTTPNFISELRKFAAILKIDSRDIHISDFWYYFRGGGLKSPNYSNKLTLDAIFTIADKMGLKLRNSPRATFDISHSPKKAVRDFCGRDPLSENDSVIVVCNTATNNPNNALSLLHEFGHMIHFLNFDHNLTKSQHYFGERGTAETVAILFESLLREVDFISTTYGLSIKESKKFIEHSKIWNLLVKRYRILLFIFEYEFLSSNGRLNHTELRKRYESYFEKFFGFIREGYDIFKPRFVILESIGYVRAQIASDQLISYIKLNYSTRWWQSTEAGKFLLENILEYGYSQSFDRLMRKIPIDPYRFVSESINI